MELWGGVNGPDRLKYEVGVGRKVGRQLLRLRLVLMLFLGLERERETDIL
jgi:hypothetical protein